MTCSAREFFGLFFNELDKQNIPSVILHSYEELPYKISSDIDYAVRDSDLPKLRGIQMELARKNNWALVQTFQHGVFAFYAVLASLDNPAENLRLDACSNYARACRFLVSESILLGNRKPMRGFYVPAPSAEFIYILAKTFDAKNKSPSDYLPRLRELWLAEPVQAQKNFVDVFGDTGRTLEQWFDSPPDEWRRLGAVMLARNRFGPALTMREGIRVMRRLTRPTGICIAVLGSDGAGKSTLISRLQTLLQPCFRHQQMLHFRPAIFEKKKTGVVTEPHAQKPRNAVTSWLKVTYYFLDGWLGWLLLILPAKIRSTLVLFDRNFDDVMIDQRRYRLSGSSWLARFLRRFLPKADRIFILSAPAELLHERKPELPVEELARQQMVLRRLTEGDRRYVLVDAARSAESVATLVWREVVTSLAAREAKRC